jgi:DNA-binding NtrC family response regulator
VKSLLTVGLSAEDRASLRKILVPHGWEIREAAGWVQVYERLRSASYSAVICECNLTGGGWKDVLVELEDFSPSPPLIVTSRHADNCLWAEVLNRRGYDVLSVPFEGKEVLRVMAGTIAPSDRRLLMKGKHRAQGGAQWPAFKQPDYRENVLLRLKRAAAPVRG